MAARLEALFFRCRMRSQVAAARMAIPATPPTTPPAIAATPPVEFRVESGVDGGAVESSRRTSSEVHSTLSRELRFLSLGACRMGQGPH
jgi:hypothetical protein